MEGIELPCRTGVEVARIVRALDGHRYVAGRLVLMHAAAFDAIASVVSGEAKALLEGAIAWSKDVLSDASIDTGSRDERLHRRTSEKEAAAVIEALWGDGRVEAQARLAGWLRSVALEPPPGAVPFDETSEDDVHPILLDAGWEHMNLTELDPARHKGAIDAFGPPIAFASARFEDAESIPKRTHLHELSAIGPIEALSAVDEEGCLREPLVLYAEGEPTYLDYVYRGVLRAAKLGDDPLG
jgi:hypothetical protein